MREIFFSLMWPETTGAKFSRILGAISILSILRFGLGRGLGQLLDEIIDWYERFVSLCLGWLDPIFDELFGLIFAFFELNIVLTDLWKPVFVLVGIYFFRDAANGFKRGRPVEAIFHYFIGVIFALVAGVSVAGFQEQVQIRPELAAAIPLICMFLYGVFGIAWTACVPERAVEYKYVEKYTGWFSAFKRPVLMGALRTIVVFIASLSIVPLLDEVSPENSGILLLLISIMLVGFYWVFYGFTESLLECTKRKGNFLEMILQSPGVNVGVAMISFFVWAFTLIALQAGLSLAGL